MIKQLSIFVENKAGRLAEITAVLAPVSYTHLTLPTIA